MKRIVTFDKANKPYGFPQLNASGSIPDGATTGSNTFVGNQIVSGTLTMPGYNEGNETILAPEGLIFATSTTQSLFGLPNGLLNLSSSPSSSTTAVISSGKDSLAAMAWFNEDFNTPGTNVVELLIGSASFGAPLSGLTIATGRSGSFLTSGSVSACFWIFNGDDCSFTVAEGGINVPTGSITISSGSLSVSGSLTQNGYEVKPYKVYTALLTQTGASNFVTQTTSTLLIGRTYTITNVGEGTDFTSVGAPNNNISTQFVATGENANWGIDGELEYDEGVPVVKVLENTIGNIWWTWASDGDYRATSNALFTLNKTYTSVSRNGSLGDNITFSSGVIDISSIYLYSGIGGDTLYPDLLNNTPIEIRVYN